MSKLSQVQREQLAAIMHHLRRVQDELEKEIEAIKNCLKKIDPQ